MAFFRKIYDKSGQTIRMSRPATPMSMPRHSIWCVSRGRPTCSSWRTCSATSSRDLAGGKGIAACAENGYEHGLFQPAHDRALDIIGQDRTNPLAALLSVALMLDYLAEKSPSGKYGTAARLIENAIQAGFEAKRLQAAELRRYRYCGNHS